MHDIIINNIIIHVKAVKHSALLKGPCVINVIHSYTILHTKGGGIVRIKSESQPMYRASTALHTVSQKKRSRQSLPQQC